MVVGSSLEQTRQYAHASFILVLGSFEDDLPRKIEHTQAINMRLVCGWGVDSVDARFDQTASESRQGIAGVDRDSSILWTYPFPFSLRVEDLESSHGLSEEQCHGSKIGMTGAVQASDFLVLLFAACSIVHVAKVILSFDVILVVTDELVFIGKLEQNCEETE